MADKIVQGYDPNSIRQYNFTPPAANKPVRSSSLRSASELGKLYDINYDADAIESIYNKASDAQYGLAQKEAAMGENSYYAQQANVNANLLDTIKKSTSAAIATGASRGLAGAEQLGLAMNAQQGAVEESTLLAQERAKMMDEVAIEKAQNIIKAMETSNALKQTLAGVSGNVYAADTQYDAEELIYAANQANVAAQFAGINAEGMFNEDNRMTNWLGTILNNEFNNKQLNATMANNKEYNSILRANGSGGGTSDNYYNYDDFTRDAQKGFNEAYAAGDLVKAAKYYVDLGYAENTKDAKKALQGDAGFGQASGNTTKKFNPIVDTTTKVSGALNGIGAGISNTAGKAKNSLSNILDLLGETPAEFVNNLQNLKK